MISKVKYEYLLGLIAVFWVLLFSYVLQLRSLFTIEGDEGSYLYAAKNLYSSIKIDDARPLFISAINGFPLLFGYSDNYVFKWILIVNLFCWFSTIFLVYKIASEQLNRKESFFIALIFVFCIGNLAITYKLLSESIFIFMLVFSVFMIYKYLNTNAIKYLSLTIALLLLAALVKPLSVGLVFVILFYFRMKLKEILTNKFSFFILISLSMIFFQMYSLKKDFGNFTISYIDSFTYYNYLGTRADCLKNNAEFVQGENDRYTYFKSLSSYRQRQVANEDMKNQLKNNKLNLLRAYFINIYINSTKGSAAVYGCKNYNKKKYFNFFQFLFKSISKIQNIIFTFIGVTLSIFILITRKKQKSFYLIISCFVLYFFFISAISSDQGDRFHIVLYPIIILLLINAGCIKNKRPCIKFFFN